LDQLAEAIRLSYRFMIAQWERCVMEWSRKDFEVPIAQSPRLSDPRLFSATPHIPNGF
jgi:hypothetical protein